MRRLKRFTIITFLVLFFLAVGAVGFLAVTVAGMGDIPDIQTPQTSTFYDNQGEVITTRFEQNRFEIPLEQMTEELILAFIAVEDHRFYSHYGIDPQGLLRAVVRNISERRYAEGGSTITQQLAKNLFLTHEKTMTRKAQEMLLTIQLERRYTKDEILEKYLNTIYFGHGAYGVEAASRTYYGKSANELTLAEAAMLSGIPRGPSYYSPIRDFDAARRRQDVVLTRMVAEGFITEGERETARAEEIVPQERNAGQEQRQLGAYFIEHLINDHITPMFPEDPQIVYTGGLHVYTTLDRQAQQAAEHAIATFVPATGRGTDGEDVPLQAALVAIDPQDGSVRALVGGREANGSGFNRAVAQPGRSPGSTFKMFTFAAALEAGHTPATIRVSEPTSIDVQGSEKPYEPTEFSRFFGPLRMREAIANSSNVIAVKTHLEIGPENSVEMAERLGINPGKLGPVASLPLGSYSVSPLEMATAYAPFANQGVRVEPRFITKIVDSNGRVIFESEPERALVLDSRVAYLMTDMMKTVLQTGTGRSLGPVVNRPAAAKTGTSQFSHDGYIVGFTPDLVAAVWVGADKPQTISGLTGATFAGPSWANFMREALKGMPARDFARPDGLVAVEICPETGLLHNPRCALQPIRELFIAGTQPTEQCSWPDCPHCPPDPQWNWDGGWWFRNPFRGQEEPEPPPEADVLPPDNGEVIEEIISDEGTEGDEGVEEYEND
jgi:1A family penicillin-binding protein